MGKIVAQLERQGSAEEQPEDLAVELKQWKDSLL
jgi:hypothetical protein